MKVSALLPGEVISETRGSAVEMLVLVIFIFTLQPFHFCCNFSSGSVAWKIVPLLITMC